ncbi:hypothetical protein RHMOL_Rhmol12G0069700 [Rhododendron molle]|uniref:Uncharacterized protein n=1 Tax=Rhododendron molle TaxID=49168 RepID=A0ACC0LFC1_RHOML|nr:hypothetical protein RHMOL_Rhmol12G0069700 [Rhododendron molle]
MDKNWMTIKNRWSKQYKQGVESFIEFAMANSGAQAEIRCPCIDCLNSKTLGREVVRIHLILKGIFFLQTTGEDGGHARRGVSIRMSADGRRTLEE